MIRSLARILGGVLLVLGRGHLLEEAGDVHFVLRHPAGAASCGRLLDVCSPLFVYGRWLGHIDAGLQWTLDWWRPRLPKAGRPLVSSLSLCCCLQVLFENQRPS